MHSGVVAAIMPSNDHQMDQVRCSNKKGSSYAHLTHTHLLTELEDLQHDGLQGPRQDWKLPLVTQK